MTQNQAADVTGAERDAMIAEFNAKQGKYAEGYNAAAVVDELIGKGYADLDEVPTTPFMSACARHQVHEFWRIPGR